MRFRIFLLLILVVGFFSCSDNNKVKIALSKGIGSANYELYASWLNKIDGEVEIINLYDLSVEDALKELESCNGLVLTGGPDVHPRYYGKDFDTARCKIDLYRDSLEFALIKKAEQMKLPVLAICRGLQIINVAYGGSLIVDIPEDTESEIPHQIVDSDVYHNVSVVEGTLLHSISESLFGVVNSNHHQAIDRIADVFVVNAVSPDGIIEGIEYKDKDKPFFIGVQWHPERMETDNRLSEYIGIAFLNEVRKKKRFDR